MPLAASSLEELEVWLDPRGKEIISSERELRSLMRIVSCEEKDVLPQLKDMPLFKSQFGAGDKRRVLQTLFERLSERFADAK